MIKKIMLMKYLKIDAKQVKKTRYQIHASHSPRIAQE